MLFNKALVLVAIMAVLMSTIDSYLLDTAQTVSTDIINVLRKEKLTDAQQILFARWEVIILGFGALIFVFKLRVIFTALVFAFSFFTASLSIPIIAALYWKKATKEGII